MISVVFIKPKCNAREQDKARYFLIAHKIIISFVLCLLTFASANGQTAFPGAYRIATDTASYVLLPDSARQMMADPSGDLSLGQVINSTRFQDQNKKIDYNVRVYWLRYHIINSMPGAVNIALPEASFDASLYAKINDGQWEHFTTGTGVAWSRRDGLKRIPAITLSIPAGDTLSIYKRQSADEIAKGIKDNSQKINHHGKRADAIVKGMLQHSRSSTGIKDPTDINALADEYLRLSYHGMRAKDKSFNCEMKTEFDESLQKISVVPQDIGRVLLNLFNNAFYACAERSRASAGSADDYVPTVTLVTRKENNHVTITVSDNGSGIPQNIKGKIFQPFFTTKPTGSGTGLGLSLSYDIVTKEHGGTINVKSREGEGTEFIIQLPVYI